MGSRSSISASIAMSSDIVRAAIQEDVAAIGISSYNGGHIDFFAEVVRQLKRQGAGDIAVFGGGGGTITHDDARLMKRKGVDQIFFAGTSLTEMADYVRKHYGTARKKKGGRNSRPDLMLARELTAIEDSFASGKRSTSKAANAEQVRAGIEHRTSNIEGDRIHGAGWRGEDDADRRTGLAFSATRTESAHRDSVARSERDRRRRAPRRSRHHDQFAGRSRFHAQHGDARTGRRSCRPRPRAVSLA